LKINNYLNVTGDLVTEPMMVTKTYKAKILTKGFAPGKIYFQKVS